jgi:hypothetical protein
MSNIGFDLEDTFVDYEGSLNETHGNPKIPMRKSIKETFPVLYSAILKRANGDRSVFLSVLYKYLERKGVVIINPDGGGFHNYQIVGIFSKYMVITRSSILVYRRTAKEFWEKIGFVEPKEE